jgi:hypothetical protein
MKKNHDIIELECWVRGETEKAYLIETDTGKGWVPKSQCEVERGVNGHGAMDSIQLPEWLAQERELI